MSAAFNPTPLADAISTNPKSSSNLVEAAFDHDTLERVRAQFKSEGFFRILNTILVSFLLASHVRAGDADDYLFRQFQTDAGLPDNTVTALAQTPDGYIWCATFGGLARFDGVRFEIFDPGNTPELPTDRWLQLSASSNGSLVVVSGFRDVFLRENGKFKRCAIEKSDYNTFAEDETGRIWVLNFHDGPQPLWQCLSGDEKRVVEGNLDFRCTFRPNSAWVAPGGAVFFAAPPVLRKSGEKGWRDFDLLPPGSSEDVLRIFPQVNGAWALTAQHLHWFDGQSVRRSLPVPAVGEYVVDVLEDNQGQLWYATTSGKLFRFDLKNGSCQQIHGLPGGGTSGIRTLLADREGNLWVGLSNRGLVQLRRKAMRTFGVKEGLTIPTIRSVGVDSEGNLWMCSLGGLHILLGDRIELLPQAYQHNLAWNVASAGGGEMWVATYGEGLFRYNPQRGSAVGGKMHQSWGEPGFTCLFSDAKGMLWLGNDTGLYRFDGKEAQTVALPVDHRVDIRAIAEGKAGAMYAGSNGRGFFARDGESAKWRQFLRADGLESEQVYALHADATGRVWIGMSGGGLARYEKGKIVSLKGLLNVLPRSVTGIQSDDLGYLLAGLHARDFWSKLSDLNAVADGQAESATILEYGPSSGMPTAACTQGIQPSVAKGKDGRMWFATLDGLVCFDPRQIPFNAQPPTVVIESVASGQSRVDLTIAPREAKKRDVLKLSAGGSRNVVARPGADPMEFEFTALSFSAPENVRFRYRMEGFEEKWIETRERKAAYQRLPPGNYNFQVRACNNDGVWNEAGASLAIVQLPYFWETLSFKIAVAGALGLLVYGAHRYRLAQMARVSRLRARIAADLHDEVGSNLGAVLINSHLLQSDANLSESSRQQVEEIRHVAQNTAQAIRETSWFINPDFDYLDEMIGRMKEVAARLGKDRDLKFSAPENVLRVPLPLEFRRNVMAIYKESLNNVVRHANAKRVDIAIALEAGRFEFEVRDDGCGFDSAKRYGGQGLRNLQRRAKDLQGNLIVRSRPGEGTSVKLNVGIS